MTTQESVPIVGEPEQTELDLVVARYADALADLDNVSAWAYLSERRKLTDWMISGARLGVVTDPAPGHSAYDGWLAIPYLDHQDRPLTIRFRCLRDHDCREHRHGKYATLHGDTARIFGVRSISDAEGTLHITEGELDALTLRQCGLPAVALPGATSWKPHWGRALAGFETYKVWADGDDAGAEMVATLRKALRGVVAVPVPRGYDVNSVYVEHGQDGIDALERGERL